MGSELQGGTHSNAVAARMSQLGLRWVCSAAREFSLLSLFCS